MGCDFVSHCILPAEIPGRISLSCLPMATLWFPYFSYSVHSKLWLHMGQAGFCLMQPGHLVFLVTPPDLRRAQPLGAYPKYSIKHLYLHGKSSHPAQLK